MYHESGDSFPIAEGLAARGINLPSSATLTEEDIASVCKALDELAA
jgi:dTDP-4-amino-4,6-dideoxygalactose transaminase